MTPKFPVRSSVYISSKHLVTARLVQKLEDKFLGPFKVVQEVSTYARRLNLLPSILYHLVFLISVLKPQGNIREVLEDFRQPVVHGDNV